MMNDKLKRVWTDPVWSKVISWGIIGILTYLLVQLVALYKETNLLSALHSILVYHLPMWVCLLAILIILIAFYAWMKSKLTRKINFDLEKEKWSIRIQNPESGSIHGIEVNAFGSYKSLPEYGKLRLFVVNPTQSKCWLNTQPMNIDTSQKKWKSQTYVGSDTDGGKTFYLIAVVDTEQPDFWVENFKKAAHAAKFYQHLPYPLPAHIIECDKVKIQRA